MGRDLRYYALFGLGFLAVLQVMLVVAVVWWPSFAENIDSLRAMSAPLPMLTQMLDTIEAGGVGAYVIGQHFFKGCNTLGTAAAILFAVGAVAGEAHRGTLEIWLARPVSRRRLLTERYLLGLAAVTLPVFLTSASVPLLLRTVDATMDLGDLMLCSAHASVFLGCFYSLTFLLSALGNEPMKIAFVMMFFSIFEFAIYMVKTITHYSVFRMADVETLIDVRRTGLDAPLFVGLLAFSAACYVAALHVLERRVP